MVIPIELSALAELLKEKGIEIEFGYELSGGWVDDAERPLKRIKCNHIYELELSEDTVTVGELITFTNYGHDLTLTDVKISVSLADPQCLDKILAYLQH